MTVLDRAIQWCHKVSAFWVVVLAVLIIIDVCGRYFFNTPLIGTAEIIKNSVVAIAFLQLPLAIDRGGMLKTTLLLDYAAPRVSRCLQVFGYLLGFLFFLAIAYSSWQPFIDAWQINEYEGEGALRVPTYPVRFLLVLTCGFAALVYLRLIYREIWFEAES
ncbi:MAG: TRAP transporter small permease [Proteobacteria bacterium]|nr:TRAP transporter small permease [Pseudomonadota bacterium]MDA1064323.1 TRAP transporter small permease [Pseudomonadota bacterium]